VELSGRIGTVALHVTAGQHDQPTTVACRAGGTYHSARMKLSIITAPFYSASGLSTPRREFAMFIFFGAVNTVLTYGIYLLLVLFIAYPAAYTVSYASGVFISYYLNARFVFKEKLRLSKAMQYPIVYLAQYLIGLGALYLLIEVAQLSKFFAAIVIVVITVPCTYLLSRYVIKGRSRTSQQS